MLRYTHVHYGSISIYMHSLNRKYKTCCNMFEGENYEYTVQRYDGTLKPFIMLRVTPVSSTTQGRASMAKHRNHSERKQLIV